MKTFKKSRVLLVSSILAAIAGCDVENPDYTPEQKANTSSPQHGGPIAIKMHEKDGYKLVNLLGNYKGADNSIDANGDGAFVNVDHNGDGEIKNVDRNGDGMIDNVDRNGDGVIADVDVNADGVIADFDLNGDGVSTIQDANGDGVFANVDVNGDGEFLDTDVNGDGTIANLDTDDDGVLDHFETEVEVEVEIEAEVEQELAAKDADGEPLTVVDLVVTRSGDRIDDIGSLGVDLLGNKVGLRPYEIAPLLDTGESHTITVDYAISDGTNKVARQLTVEIEGEDFAPEFTGNLIGNFTRDAGSSNLDGLKNVVDLDEEMLTIGNLVASDDNPFDLPITVNGTTFDVDVSSVESNIPDGQKVTFNFTYTISDHRFDVERSLVINVLGVQDIAGAPLVLNYFKTDEFDETDGLKTYDLTAEIDEREGDAIVISDLMLDGSADLPYGVKFEGTTLSFNPNAFYDDIAAGTFKEFLFTYKVADENGNVSDGTPELTLTVNGVESNLLKALGADVGFENGGTGIGNTWCDPGSEITNSLSANGEHSFQMLGAPCYAAIQADYFPDLGPGEKYFFSYNAYVGAGDASPYFMISADPNGAHNFWQGARPWHPANGSWRPLMITYDTDAGYLATENADGEKPIDNSESLRMFFLSAWMGNDGMPAFDDFNMVRYDNLEGVDVITGNVGSFEDADYVPTVTGGGTIEVQADPNDADNKVLYVDTTGADDAGVKISFPIERGAIVPGGKYRVTYDVQYLNFDANKEAGTDPNINQWGGYRFEVVFANPDNDLTFSMFSDVWNGNAFGTVQGIADERTHWLGFGAETNWESDNITASFVLKGVGAQYIIDNVKIDRMP